MSSHTDQVAQAIWQASSVGNYVRWGSVDDRVREPWLRMAEAAIGVIQAPARAKIAWLLWCANQGYINEEDRAILRSPNIFEMDPSALHPDDQNELHGWLDMADKVIAALVPAALQVEESKEC